MISLYYEGGPLYMGGITLLAIVLVSFAIYTFTRMNSSLSSENRMKHFRILKEMGLLALVFGLFSMCISFTGMFAAIEQAGDVSSAVLAGGMKVMMIPVVYGFIIFLLSRVILIGFSWKEGK